VPSPAHDRDYGARSRRADSFAAARDRYKRALAAGTNPDATLVTSYQRMRFRTTPEVAGGASLRSDPQAWSWRAQAGASLPFVRAPCPGSHRLATIRRTTDKSETRSSVQDVARQREALVTGLGAHLLLGDPRRGVGCWPGPTRATWSQAGTDATAS
jgi:hypothetical protein